MARGGRALLSNAADPTKSQNSQLMFGDNSPAAQSYQFDKLKGAKAGAAGLQSAGLIMQHSIFEQNANARMVSLASQLQEQRYRHDINVRLLRKRANRQIAGQQEAFIAAGVELEGSAIDVVNDTLMDLLDAEMNKQREIDFMAEQTAMQQESIRQNVKQQRMATAMNVGASLLGGFA